MCDRSVLLLSSTLCAREIFSSMAQAPNNEMPLIIDVVSERPDGANRGSVGAKAGLGKTRLSNASTSGTIKLTLSKVIPPVRCSSLYSVGCHGNIIFQFLL